MVTTTLSRAEGLAQLSVHSSRHPGMLRVTSTLRGAGLWVADLPSSRLAELAREIVSDSEPGQLPAEPDLVYYLAPQQTALPTCHGICWHTPSHPGALITMEEVRRLAEGILRWVE